MPTRQREFAIGRALARRALARFGAPPLPLPRGAGGAPVWPPGFVGSLTHCPGLCVAAIARTDHVLGLGLDAEPLSPLPTEVLALVCTPDEIAHHATLPARPGLDWGLLAFGAKEAWYKCQWPSRRQFLAFGDVVVRFALPVGDAGTFRIVIPGQDRAATAARGIWRMQAGFQLCAVILPRPDRPFA